MASIRDLAHSGDGAAEKACTEYDQNLGRAVGENVAKVGTAKAPARVPFETVEAWMASTGHRNLILSESLEMGIGVRRDIKGIWWVTMNAGWEWEWDDLQGSGQDRGAAAADAALQARAAAASAVRRCGAR